MALKYYHVIGAISLVIIFSAKFTVSSKWPEFPVGFSVNHFTSAESTGAVNLSEYDPAFEKDKLRISYFDDVDLNYEVNAVMESQNLEEIKVTREEESYSPGFEIEGCLMWMVRNSIRPTEFIKKSFGKSYYLNFYLRKTNPDSECKAIFHHEKNCCQIVVDRICDYWMRRIKGWRVHVPLDSVTQRVYENNHDLIQNYCNTRIHRRTISICWEKRSAARSAAWRRNSAKKMCPKFLVKPDCTSITPLLSNV